MYRRELIFLGGLIAAVFMLLALSSYLLAQALQKEANMVAIDTLPGLVNTGEAISRMNENWQNTKDLLDLSSPTDRSKLIQKIQANSTEDLWQAYQKSIFDPDDELLYQKTIESRTKCRASANHYYSLINGGNLIEARQFLALELSPAFQAYNKNTFSLFQHNQKIGEQRARHIIQLTRWLPMVAAGFCSLVFSFGILIGLKGALGSLVFTTRFCKPPATNIVMPVNHS